MQITQAQIEALTGFRSALRRFLAFSEEATKKAGVTAIQYQAMLVVEASPDRTIKIGELGDELLLKRNGAVQLVDRLSKLGLIERQRSTSDLRSVSVALTEEGRSTLFRLASLHLAQLSKRRKQLANIVRQLKALPSD